MSCSSALNSCHLQAKLLITASVNGLSTEAVQTMTKLEEEQRKRNAAVRHLKELRNKVPCIPLGCLSMSSRSITAITGQDIPQRPAACTCLQVEACIYDLREKLCADLQPYSTDEERTKISSTLDNMEEWLYTDEVTSRLCTPVPSKPLRCCGFRQKMQVPECSLPSCQSSKGVPSM